MRLKKILANILFVLVLSVPAISTSIAQAQPLKQAGVLPKTDPYCGTNGYLKTALNIEDENDECTGITVVSVPDEVSDWVLVELRAVAKGAGVDAATAGTVEARAPAFLLKNGHVVGATEFAALEEGIKGGCLTNFNADTCELVRFNFQNDMIAAMDLYVVVRHINHLDIISNEALTTTDTTDATVRYTYDFTDEETKAKGGSLALKKIVEDESVKSVMYVGDVNGDTNINAADYLQIHGDIGQTPTDPRSNIDFDGEISTTDADSPLLRANFGRTVQVP